jgi:hypothetical protein
LERIASRNARKEEEARLKPILEAEEAWQAAYKQRWAKIAFEEKLKSEEAQFEDERIKQEAIDVEREHLGYGIELNGQKYKIKAFANLDGITIQDGTTSDIPKENMLLKTQSFQLQDSDQYMKSTFDGEGTRKARFFICEGIDFSHNPSAPFSLKNEMNNVGYRDIGDFFQQIVKVVENPTALVDLSKRIAHISNEDSFQLVVARLLQSVSFNSDIVKDADINNWVVAADLAGLGMNSQRRLSESLFKIARSVVTNSIRTHGLSGLEIVRKIEIGAVAWNQVSDGKTVFGDDSEAARLLLVGVVLQSILHCLKSAQSSQHVIESLSGSKGQNLSLREEARLMTEIGRQYARANGIDYDDFVRRHFGIHE